MPETVQSCPLCGARPSDPFVTLASVPIFCCVLWPSAQEAKAAPTCVIELTNCPTCGLIYNRAFDASAVAYAPGYENAQHFSSHFRGYAEALAQRLIENYDLAGGVVAEIGAGDGYFLDLMTSHGMRLGIGYDPSIVAERRSNREGTIVELVPEPFEADRLPPTLDAVICRHVLEHLAKPLDFVRNLRNALGPRNPVLYFEVPNALLMLDNFNFAEIIFEHFTSWTPGTLEALFTLSGFSPSRISTDFGDQFLSIDCRPSNRRIAIEEILDQSEIDQIADRCHKFGAQYKLKMHNWRKMVSDIKQLGRVAMVWGAGARGVMFVNLAGATGQEFAGVVDVNPRKWGKFVPGSGLPVIPPDQLASLRPEIIVLPNKIYHREVSECLVSYGLDPEIWVIG